MVSRQYMRSSVRGEGHRQKKAMEKPSDWMTVQLEAFSLLCLENYNEMLDDRVNNVSNPRQPKWTADGRGKAKNKGWAKEGITRFSDLVRLVKEDRGRTGDGAEEAYLVEKREEWGEKHPVD
jgi:hypothetical protein